MESDPSEMAKRYAILYTQLQPKPNPEPAPKPQRPTTADEAREHEINETLQRIRTLFPAAEDDLTWQRLLHLIAEPLRAPRGTDKLSSGQAANIAHRTQEAFAVAGALVDSTNPTRKRNQQVDELAKWLIGSPDHLSLKSAANISAAFSQWTGRIPVESRGSGRG